MNPVDEYWKGDAVNKKGKTDKGRVRILPNSEKRQSFQKALEETNRQYAQTLAKLANPDFEIKSDVQNKGRDRLMSRPCKRRPLEEMLVDINKRFGGTLARLAKGEQEHDK